MQKHYKNSTQYFREASKNSAVKNNFSFLKIYNTIEYSNDVIFANTINSSFTLDLSGTSKHLTVMDGIMSDAPTRPGDICQIPAGLEARFAWEVVGEHQRSIMVEFDQELFKSYCPELLADDFLDGHLEPKNYANQTSLASIIKILSSIAEPNGGGGNLVTDTAIRLFAIEVATKHWTRQPLPLNYSKQFDKRIRRAMDYIQANFREDISLLTLSEISGLCTTRLIHLFKMTTGYTPYVYLLNKRVNHAIHLLRTRDLPLCQIAFEVGFADQQHMSHAFRKQISRTPLSFRGSVTKM